MANKDKILLCIGSLCLLFSVFVLLTAARAPQNMTVPEPVMPAAPSSLEQHLTDKAERLIRAVVGDVPSVSIHIHSHPNQPATHETTNTPNIPPLEQINMVVLLSEQISNHQLTTLQQLMGAMFDGKTPHYQLTIRRLATPDLTYTSEKIAASIAEQVADDSDRQHWPMIIIFVLLLTAVILFAMVLKYHKKNLSPIERQRVLTQIKQWLAEPQVQDK